MPSTVAPAERAVKGLDMTNGQPPASDAMGTTAIIPAPRHIEPRPGLFLLRPDLRVSCGPGAEPAGQLLPGYPGLRGAIGHPPTVWLELASRGPGPEAYLLDIRPT